MFHIIASLIINLNAISLPGSPEDTFFDDERRERPIPYATILKELSCLPVKIDRYPELPVCRDHLAGEIARTIRVSKDLAVDQSSAPITPEIGKNPRLPKRQADTKLRTIGPKFLQDTVDMLDLKSPGRHAESQDPAETARAVEDKDPSPDRNVSNTFYE